MSQELVASASATQRRALKRLEAAAESYGLAYQQLREHDQRLPALVAGR